MNADPKSRSPLIASSAADSTREFPLTNSPVPSTGADKERTALANAAPASSSSSSSAIQPSPPLCEPGEVTLIFSFGKYIGEVHPQNPALRHGKGQMIYHNGNTYTGEWKEGAPDGLGEKKYLNGDCFVGYWVKGKREGRGSYLFQEGHIFEGMYVQDQPEGYGTLNTIEDDRYSGGWKGGVKHGVGLELLHTGDLFTGTWVKGEKHGPGVLRLPGVKKPVYGVWEHHHYLRELTGTEIEEWKTTVRHPEWSTLKREKTCHLSKKSSVRPFPPSSRGPPSSSIKYLPGERAEDWDEEFERNSSDDEREEAMGRQIGGEGPPPTNENKVAQDAKKGKEKKEIVSAPQRTMDDHVNDVALSAEDNELTPGTAVSPTSLFSSVLPPNLRFSGGPSQSNPNFAALEQSILSMEAKLNFLEMQLGKALEDEGNSAVAGEGVLPYPPNK